MTHLRDCRHAVKHVLHAAGGRSFDKRKVDKGLGCGGETPQLGQDRVKLLLRVVCVTFIMWNKFACKCQKRTFMHA